MTLKNKKNSGEIEEIAGRLKYLKFWFVYKTTEAISSTPIVHKGIIFIFSPGEATS